MIDDEKIRDPETEKLLDSESYKPIGGLYDDKRDHGSGTTQHADEGTLERDLHGNKSAPSEPNAGGSPTRRHSSEHDAAGGHGNQ